MNHPNKKTFDPTVFDNLETKENAAWLLGFLIADGCLKQSKSGQKTITLSVAEFDRDAVDNFVKIINTNATVVVEKPRGWTKSNPVRVCLTSQVLFDKLVSLGVTPRKTGSERVPEFLSHNRHVWRGVIDGDGSLFLRKSRSKIPSNPTISLASSSQVLVEQFSEFSRKAIGKEKTISSYVMKSGKKYFSYILTGDNAISLISLLYNDCSTYLERKHKKYLEFSSMKRRPGWAVRWGYD